MNNRFCLLMHVIVYMPDMNEHLFNMSILIKKFSWNGTLISLRRKYIFCHQLYLSSYICYYLIIIMQNCRINLTSYRMLYFVIRMWQNWKIILSCDSYIENLQNKIPYLAKLQKNFVVHFLSCKTARKFCCAFFILK